MAWKGGPLGCTADGNPIEYDGPIAVLGPPGTSKTVSFVANLLLDGNQLRRRRLRHNKLDSYVVIDPKAELAAITSQYRRSVGDVKIINPFGVLVNERPDLASDGWNPLGDLAPNTSGYASACASIGDALVAKNPRESQPFFPMSTRSAFTGACDYEVRRACAEGRPPSLANVREMLTRDAEALVELVKEMIALGDSEITPRMRKFLNDGRSIQDVKATVEAESAWMTPEMVADMSVTKGTDFRACKQRPTTIYIIIPSYEPTKKAPYLRLCVASALRALYRQGGVPTTLLIEEAFVLGHLAELEQACGILRGYGGRIVTVWQSLQQCKKNYPDTWGLFLSGAVLSFRPADSDTARWLVEKAGTEIVPVLGASDPTRQESEIRPSWQQQKRERIPLAKMFGMPPGKALVWLPGDEAPRIAHMKGYFEIPWLLRRASANPYYQAGAKRRGRNVLRGLVAASVVALAIANPDLVRAVAHAVAGLLK